MNHRVRQVEEEGLVRVLADEAHGLFGVALGQEVLVRGRLDDDLVAHQGERRPARAGAGDHVVRVGDPVVLVEAVAGGEELELVTEVPLADTRGGVAHLLQGLGEGQLIRVETLASAGEEDA